MDSIEITINRTGAATTIAARHLARRQLARRHDLRRGRAGPHPAQGDRGGVPLEHVHVWDIRPEAAEPLAREPCRTSSKPRRAAERRSRGGARRATSSSPAPRRRTAFLTPDLVRPGTFIAAVGADNSDKQEIAPALYAARTVVVDSLEQCAEIGDLHHALKAGAVTRDAVHATLGRAGRRHRSPAAATTDEITLFDSSGTWPAGRRRRGRRLPPRDGSRQSARDFTIN